jgi:prevent-host-death family protein
MHTVNMHEAKTKLSLLVKEAVSGEDVVIAKAGKPLVRLVPVGVDDRNRVPGRYKGQISIAPDFDETPEELIAAFEGVS